MLWRPHLLSFASYWAFMKAGAQKFGTREKFELALKRDGPEAAAV